MNYLSVAVATVAAFAMSSVWYIVFGKQRMKLLADTPGATADVRKVQPLKIFAELVRTLVLAYVLARFVVGLGVTDWKGAISLGLWVWIGFPFMILSGSVLWDKRPWKLAAIHAGDWFVKVLLITVILGVWR
jgi:hypothetical protein